MCIPPGRIIRSTKSGFSISDQGQVVRHPHCRFELLGAGLYLLPRADLCHSAAFQEGQNAICG